MKLKRRIGIDAAFCLIIVTSALVNCSVADVRLSGLAILFVGGVAVGSPTTTEHVKNELPTTTPQNINVTGTHPRTLTSLPHPHPPQNKSTRRKNKRLQVPDSALNRARLLLGSLNRQNCFAKVLCGLGAREPTTKTGLLNDYVYLMEEFVMDDEPDDEKQTKKKKRKKKKKKKTHTKNEDDDSKSSMSKSDEESDTALTDWNFLADATLAAEDPQVLKYVQLEEKRRQYKNQLPEGLFMGRTGTASDKNASVPSQGLTAQQPIHKLRTGKTFGGSQRQCRTFRDRCPFDDVQMGEIITNLKRLLSGRGQQEQQQQQGFGTASKTTTRVTTGDGQIISSQGGSGSGSTGSKVEIILHLNQNQPYGSYHHPQMPPMPPMHFNPHFQQQQHQQQITNTPIATTNNSNNPASSLAPPQPPWPQLQVAGSSDPRYPLGQSGVVYSPYYPQVPTTTEPTTTTTTTPRSPGEEQLLDFLYGVVNFNETVSEQSDKLLEEKKQTSKPTTNPYWSAASTALNQANYVEHELKVRDRDKDESYSSEEEEEELKTYIKSLKVTLKNLAKINNVTIGDDGSGGGGGGGESGSEEEKEHDDVDSSEELQDEKSDEEVEKEVVLKPKTQKKPIKAAQAKAPTPLSNNNATTIMPPSIPAVTSPPPSLFDPDNDDNIDTAVIRNDPKPVTEEDDEYEPEDDTETDDTDTTSTSAEDSTENTSQNNAQLDQDDLAVSKENHPPKISLKFSPLPPEKQVEDLTPDEKRNLAALSAALLPHVPETFSTSKKKPPHKDTYEEIRIPTAKPISKAFQSVSTIGKNKVINIDEWENLENHPVFAKKRKKKKNVRPVKMRYQGRRREPMRRRIKQENIKHKKKSDHSSEDNKGRLGLRNKIKNYSPTPLISYPLHPPLTNPTNNNHPDLYDSVMNYMGMRPVKKQLSIEEDEEDNLSYSPSLLQGKIGISIPIEYDGGRDDVPVPLPSAPPPPDTPQKEEEGGGEHEKDKEKKDKKKKGKKKEKKKKKKKKKKSKDKESSGYSTQFHQQIHPPHAEPGLWEKIKVFVDTLAASQSGAGETPFIHLGFSESDPLDGHPHAVINDGGGGGGGVSEVGYGGGGGDDNNDDDDTGEEEEDDIVEEKKRGHKHHREEMVDLENASAMSEAEYEGIDYENDDESNETKEVTTVKPVELPYSPLPAVSLPGLSQQTTTQPPSTTTTKPIKTTIAPKPPKYIVDRQQLKVKKRRKKKKKAASSTVTPPIMLLVSSSTTTTAPTTTTTPPPTAPTDKPPKRRIIYKPPAKRVNIQSPTNPPPIPTPSIKPPTLKPTPLEFTKPRVEDDEVEPPSHFFQPGPNGQNVVGRPPVPIDAFHIQSEDMLIDTDTEELDRQEEKLRSHYRRRRPFTYDGDGIVLGGDSQSEEEQELPTSILIATTSRPRPRPRPFQIHAEVMDYNPEETREKKRRKKIQNNKEKDESGLTSSVMKSPIFSDYFKHLYASFLGSGV